METLIERLKKIEALANSGSAGERENAQRLLSALCRKYGVTLDQIADQKIAWHTFAVRGELERCLFRQVLVHVMQTRKIVHRKAAKSYECALTTAQAIDVRDCWEHYRAAWRAQLDDFVAAFICKNHIFGPKEDDGASAPAAEATAKRISALMRGIEAQPWEKRLRLPC